MDRWLIIGVCVVAIAATLLLYKVNGRDSEIELRIRLLFWLCVAQVVTVILPELFADDWARQARKAYEDESRAAKKSFQHCVDIAETLPKTQNPATFKAKYLAIQECEIDYQARREAISAFLSAVLQSRGDVEGAKSLLHN